MWPFSCLFNRLRYERIKIYRKRRALMRANARDIDAINEMIDDERSSAWERYQYRRLLSKMNELQRELIRVTTKPEKRKKS